MRVLVGGLVAVSFALFCASSLQAIADPRDSPRAVLELTREEFRDCDFCPEIVMVPGGSFSMGSPESEVGRWPFEGAQRRVTLEQFAAGKYEVTFEEWAVCVQRGGCASGPAGRAPITSVGRQPVVGVSWSDAQEYVTWLSGETGKNYRLLTEAEWEYAARAGTTTSWSWGADPNESCRYDNILDRSMSLQEALYVNCDDGSGNQSMAVGSYLPNAFGLFDMAGNVSEWVQDCGSFAYRGAPSNGNAFEVPGCETRVARGGNFRSPIGDARSAHRFAFGGLIRSSWVGFRVARSL